MASLEPSTRDKFYWLLLLLEALDPTRGERSKSGAFDDAIVDLPSIRRAFVDSIAYICAYDKGPDCVTAAALRQTSERTTTICLAGNKGIHPKVVTFLISVLEDLTGIARLPRGKVVDQAKSLATGKLSSDIINFVRLKLQRYYSKSVNKFIPPCLEAIAGALNEGTKENVDVRRLTALQEWLKKFTPRNTLDLKGAELEAVVQECYDLRRSDLVSSFKLLGAQGQSCFKDFQGLAKLLGKLAKPIAAAESLATAAFTLPVDFVLGFEIEIVESSAPRKVALSQNLTFEEIVSKILTSEEIQKKYLNRLQKLTSKESISAIYKRKCKFNVFVHAELLLLNRFYERGYEFAARDKYIACSKHACYLCHAYIKNHPGNFTPPPTHHKIYKSWRVPDSDIKDSNSLASEDETLQLMSGQMYRDLLAEIDSGKPRRSLRADSPPH